MTAPPHLRRENPLREESRANCRSSVRRGEAHHGRGTRESREQPAPRLYCVPRASTVEGDLSDDGEGVDLAEVSEEEALKDGTHVEAAGQGSGFQRKVRQLNRRVARLHQLDAKAIRLEVDRGDLFHDSFRAFQRIRTGPQLRGPLQVPPTSQPPHELHSHTPHCFE
jgi:hypothetical protein